MSHEIEGDRIFTVREPAWHELGKVLANPPTSAEAIQAAGMDWRVEKRRLFWEAPPRNKNAADVMTMQEITNKFAIVRDMDESLLAVVGKDYTPLQNTDAFDFFDPIIKQGTAEYESAGVLRNGRRVWVLAKLKNTQNPVIAGYEHKNYVLLTNGHDGMTGVSVSAVNCRVVCANTMRIALAEGGVSWFTHRGDVPAKLDAAYETLHLASAALFAHNAQLTRMSHLRLGIKDAENIMNDVLGLEAGNPATEDEIIEGAATESGEKHRLRMRDAVLTLYEGYGTEITDAIRGTGYGLFSATTEFVDHYYGMRSKDRANLTLFGDGDRLKRDTFAALAAMV